MSVKREANPKYVRIARDLRSEISLHYTPGDYLPSVRALQQQYGATVKTVRQALSLLAEEGLVQTLPHRGTVVTPDPASTRSARIPVSADNPLVPSASAVSVSRAGADTRKTVAILMPLPAYIPPLALEAERELRRHGLPMQLCGNLDLPRFERGDIEAAQAYEREVLESVARDDVAGVIWWSVFGVPCRETARRLLDQGIPIVLLDSLIPDLSADWVGIDDFGASVQATQHLLQVGHTEIVFLADNAGDYLYPVSCERMLGFLDTMYRADPIRYASYRTMPVDLHFDYKAEVFSLLPTPLREMIYFYDYRSEETLEALLARTPRPSAVVAGNDHVAYSFLAKWEVRGLRAPQDMAVVSFGGVDRDSNYFSMLTTVRQPIEQMGRRAVRLLLERRRQPDRPLRHIHLTTQLIVRASCGTKAPAGASVGEEDRPDRAAVPAV